MSNNEEPSKTKVQVINASQAFIITDYFNDEESKKYVFKSIEDISIKVGTSPSSNSEKLDDCILSNKNEIYGISVIHNEVIEKVHIKYRFLGISFNETVFVN